MLKEQAIATAQSALRLKHNVTHVNDTVWHWERFGWKVTMASNGAVLSVVDTFGQRS